MRILTVTLNAAVDKRYEMETFAAGCVNRTSTCRLSAGGKGLNVSRVAALAGDHVTATGFTGGYTGRLIEKLAEDDGIDTEFVHTTSESRTCINVLDKATGIQTEILEGGMEIPEEKQEELLEKYNMLINHADVVTISGSLPKGVPSRIYSRMIEEAKQRKKPVLLDTSGAALCESIKAVPTLIKPNQDEIKQLTGVEIQDMKGLIEAAKQLLSEGIAYVVISLGKDGSLLVSGHGIWKASVPKLDAVNTVGCGDAMLAAFAHGLCRQWEEEKMLRYASAVSAANAMHERTGYFEEDTCKNLYPQIQIEKIKQEG